MQTISVKGGKSRSRHFRGFRRNVQLVGTSTCAALALWSFLALRALHELRPALRLSPRRCQRLHVLNGCDNCLSRGNGQTMQLGNQPTPGNRCVEDEQVLLCRCLPVETSVRVCVCMCPSLRFPFPLATSPWTTMPVSMIHCQACQPKIHSSRLCVASVLACKSKNPASHDCVLTDDKV